MSEKEDDQVLHTSEPIEHAECFAENGYEKAAGWEELRTGSIDYIADEAKLTFDLFLERVEFFVFDFVDMVNKI